MLICQEKNCEIYLKQTTKKIVKIKNVLNLFSICICWSCHKTWLIHRRTLWKNKKYILFRVKSNSIEKQERKWHGCPTIFTTDIIVDMNFYFSIIIKSSHWALGISLHDYFSMNFKFHSQIHKINSKLIYGHQCITVCELIVFLVSVFT